MFIGGSMGQIIMSWLLSVIGIVVIGVLINLILPEGEIQKYIKAIFSVFVVFIMIYPILNIDISKINYDEFFYNQTSVTVDEKYLENYKEKYRESLQNQCETVLNNNGYQNVRVEIYLNLSSEKFEIEKVYVNLKNLVINENSVHIDKYKEIKSIIVSLLDVEEGKVIMNE